MRIGILTYHTSINNGAVIQCYSLARRVACEFPEDTVEVIDYRMPKIEDFYNKTYKKELLNKHFLRNLIKLKTSPNYIEQAQVKRKVFKENLRILPLSEFKIEENDVENLFKKIDEYYDFVIAGSDAIWNFELRGYPNPYYLSKSISSLKFSYAASCYGMPYEKLPLNRKKEICQIFDSYCLLGVRDDESRMFAEKIGCKAPIIHTCDPTVFLDVDQLPVSEKRIRSIIEERGGDFSKPFIGVMGDERMCKMAKNIVGNEYQIVSLFNYCKNADINLFDITPYEWAYVFRFFKLTFTTYFHGTLLSFRNGIPVICVALENPYSENHKSKVEDFLERIGFEDCYFHTDYKIKEIDRITQKAISLLSKDLRKVIIDAMNKEALTAIPFFEKMKSEMKID